MPHKILVPIAANQTANERFHQVFHFADKTGASVTLFTVVDDLSPVRLAFHARMSPLQLLETAIANEQKRLQDIFSQLQPYFPRVQFNAKVSSGMPFIEIIKEADAGQYDLIAVDANRGDKRSATQFGSNTRHLMRKSPIPVWALTMHVQKSIDRIAAAVDVASPTDAGLALNETILEYAFNMAENQQSKLHVFHAWRLAEEGFLRNWERHTDIEIAQFAKQEHERRAEALASLLDRFADRPVEVHSHLVEGLPQVMLPSFISQNSIDVLCMGTLCRTGIAGFIIGNTAEATLDAVNCSVVSLKPEGFRSPILE